jgi:hypothetical protein
MKYSVLKWSLILSVLAAIALFASWVISLPSDENRAQLAFGKDHAFAQVALAKGKLIVCDHFANREVLNHMDRSRNRAIDAKEEQRVSFFGFCFRRATFASPLPNKDGQTIWSMDVTLLLPCLIMMLIAGLLGWRSRRLGPVGTASPAAS